MTRVLLVACLVLEPMLVACGSDDSSSTSPAGRGGSGNGGTNTAGTGGALGAEPSGKWSMGYYTSWKPEQYPVSEIEWAGLTHIAMAFYTPGASGSLSLMGGYPALADDLVTAAHGHGVKAIASLGGADSAAAFRQATASASLPTFVDSLVALLAAGGYDGLDVDWEPLEMADEPVVIALANQVRARVPNVLLTIPVGYVNVNLGADLSNYAAIADVYDQINVMSYGMAGAWQGWKSWHSSPLYQQDSATPTSIDSSVARYVAAGVPRGKLGIGIGFYGLCYGPPVTGPGQTLDGSTILASDATTSYANIMSRYFSSTERAWDSLARVPYLSFDSAKAPDGCTYISYDDEQSIAEKAAYLDANGLGGAIEWEINEAYLASAPAGQRSPLLTAIGAQILK